MARGKTPGARLTLLHVSGGEGIAEAVPDTQHPHPLLLFPDVEDDTVDAASFAEEQMMRGKAEFLSLGNNRAPRGHFLKAENSFEQTGEPSLRLHGRSFANALKGSIRIVFRRPG